MDQFSVILPSNDESFPDNTIATYEICLPRRIILEGTWVVGVQGISYTKSWFNLTKDSRVHILRDDGTRYAGTAVIKAGYYSDEELIVDTVNKVLGTMTIYFRMSKTELPSISFNKITRRVEIINGYTESHNLFLELEEELCEMLGITIDFSKEFYEVENPETVTIMKNRIKGVSNSFRHYDLHAGLRTIFLYSNIVSESIVGSKYTNLLKVVPIPPEKRFGEQVDIDFSHIEYQSVNTTSLQKISISLFDDSGREIPFKFGRTIVKLHFKKDESLRELLS